MNREQRLDEEFRLLRSRFPEITRNGDWFLIPEYAVPANWAPEPTVVVFRAEVGYPGAPPYGFWVPFGTQCNNQKPGSYTEPAKNNPPFPGHWGFFSWSPHDQWQAKEPVVAGSTLLNWALGFRQRFEEGL